MKLTTKGRFAVTAMVDLALHNAQAPIALVQISDRHHISVAYLEQIFRKLRRAGLVESVRGPGGGYRLSALPSEINVAEIIDAVEEDLDATQCHGNANCTGGAACITHHLWEKLNSITKNFLSGVSLETIIESHKRDSQSSEVQPISVFPNRERKELTK